MCTFVEHDGDRYLGRILRFQDHRDANLGHQHAVEQLFGIPYIATGNTHRLYRNLLNAFRSRAHTAVIENFYFDLDYRSELGRLQEVAFLPMVADASRVHFFGDRVRGTGLRLRDFVSTATEYLGYIVVRPQSVGAIGRSIVPSRATIGNGKVSPELAERRIRTAVREPVQLFGVDLEAVGIPFMEQDGRLLRCAHVSAWMAHYAAVLRGDATRRPSGQFHASDLGVESVGRPFPSQGLSVPMLSALLRTMDLPPEVIDEAHLHKRNPKKRESNDYAWNWSDNPIFQSAVAATDPNAAIDSNKNENFVWVRHNLTSAVARYLNSSVPVILTRSAKEHAQVIVGYLRESDLATHLPETLVRSNQAPSDVEQVQEDHADGLQSAHRLTNKHHDPIKAFIVSDDQAGPFQLVNVDTLVRQILKREQGIYLLVPLPRSLWMSGSTAELFGIKWLEYFVEDRLTNAKVNKPALADFSEAMHRDGTLAVRTFMTTGTDLKRSVAHRIQDPEVVRSLGQMQLPRYVWVVEVFERPVSFALAKASAMIVFDPTGPVNRDNEGFEDEDSAEPLFVYLPGMAVAYGAYGAAWFKTIVETYDSGRSGHSPGLGRAREGWKLAVAGGSARY